MSKSLRLNLIRWLKDNPQDVHWNTLAAVKRNTERAGFLTTLNNNQWTELLQEAGYQKVTIEGQFSGYKMAESLTPF